MKWFKGHGIRFWNSNSVRFIRNRIRRRFHVRGVANRPKIREGRRPKQTVSEADRTRWNDRYQSGEYVGRTHPTELIRRWLSICPMGSALDLACGSGRNSRFLADSGYEVVGVDISNVALELAAAKSSDSQRKPRYEVQDLENAQISRKFDLIVMVRYVNFDLVSKFDTHLRPNGILMIEEHLFRNDIADLAGPKDPSFRVEAGSLKSQLKNVRILHEFEGLTQDPDGNKVALSQIVARKASVD